MTRLFLSKMTLVGLSISLFLGANLVFGKPPKTGTAAIPSKGAESERCPSRCYCAANQGNFGKTTCPMWDLPECQSSACTTPDRELPKCVAGNGNPCKTLKGPGAPGGSPNGDGSGGGWNRPIPAVACAVPGKLESTIGQVTCWKDPKGCIKKKAIEETVDHLSPVSIPSDTLFPKPGSYPKKLQCYTCCKILDGLPNENTDKNWELKCQDCCDGGNEPWCSYEI